MITHRAVSRAAEPPPPPIKASAYTSNYARKSEEKEIIHYKIISYYQINVFVHVEVELFSILLFCAAI